MSGSWRVSTLARFAAAFDFGDRNQRGGFDSQLVGDGCNFGDGFVGKHGWPFPFWPIIGHSLGAWMEFEYFPGAACRVP